MPGRPVPEREQVRPGIWSLPIAMPGPLDYVFVYALETPGGVVLVDAAWDGDAALAELEAHLASFGATIEDVQGVLFTHAHLDHYGLSGRIRARSGAWLAMHELEVASLHRDDAPSEELYAVRRDWLIDSGVEGAELDAMLGIMQRLFRNDAPRPVPPDRLFDRSSFPAVDSWQIEFVETPGHSPGHVTYVIRDEGIAFTGDHILSDTTPIVSVFPGTRGNPLSLYLDSLERTVPLGDLLALAGHEGRTTVGPRARELQAHHDLRLRDVQRGVEDGAETVREIAEHVAWKKPLTLFTPGDMQMAIGEVRAHLLVLEDRGAVRTVEGDGPRRWAPSS
jgi:glyoxylase-like metal-dependent hydrolase (beta-lactamase superfamily II)